MKNHTILLVEDNPDDVKLTLHAFKQCGIVNRVVVVNNGVDALDYLFGRGAFAGRDLRDQPAVVLLDLRLPKLDGLEVLRRMRADDRTRTQPVVVMTSSKEEEDITASYNLGANGYVRKPVDFDRFNEAVRQLGLFWLLLNEPPPARPSAS
jgi:two-component system, response regulator